MSKFSKGLRNGMLDTGSLKSQLDLGFLKIYEGTPPDSPDDAFDAKADETLLCTISVDGLGTGLTFEALAVDGVLSKEASETWKGTNAATGTAQWYRFVGAADDGLASTSQPRIQGSVGTAGADLNLSDVALVAAEEQVINHYAVVLPTL